MTPPVLEVDVSVSLSRSFFLADVVQNLEDTLRGTNGFGSTGGHVSL